MNVTWFSLHPNLFIFFFLFRTVAMSVTTLFQCFLVDEEMLGNEGSLYVPNEIDEFLARLDESRKAELNVPKVVEETDAYTVESGMAGDNTDAQNASRTFMS